MVLTFYESQEKPLFYTRIYTILDFDNKLLPGG